MTKLEYEAYTSLALKTLSTLLEKAHTRAPFLDNPVPISANAAPSSTNADDRVSKCYIAHRLGQVKVGECSILIAVSSPHRKEAFVVAEWLLEEVKKNVAIWKCEFYGNGENVVARDGGEVPIDPPRAAGGEDQAMSRDGAEWSWKANFPST